MSCLDREVGSFAISLTHPAGVNPREGLAFSLAQIEVDKLNNIHAESGVDSAESRRCLCKSAARRGQGL